MERTQRPDEGLALPLPRVRITILHLMAATLVIALALAPIPGTLRSPTPEYVVATGAYEVIFLPVLIALIVMAMMAPGRERTFVIASLCATPVILLVGLFVASYASVLVLVAVQMMVSPEPFTVLYFAWFVWTTFFLLPHGWRPKRCPACRARSLRALSQPAPGKKMWLVSGIFRCGNCGRSYRAVGSWFWSRLVPEEPLPPI